MQPSALTAASFSSYPPEARALAISQLFLLRSMPLALVPILLRELISYDWKLPAERHELDRQFTFLSSLSAAARDQLLAGFQALTLGPDLIAYDWVNLPSGFIELLTAFLWSTHQIDSFRTLADNYATAVNNASPAAPPRSPRLAIVIVGAGTESRSGPLFRKLRPHGLSFSKLDPHDGLGHVLALASRRATKTEPSSSHTSITPDYRHWVIDGGTTALPGLNLTSVSYAALEQPRALLLQHIQEAIKTGTMGPEGMRTFLARLKPSDIGLGATAAGAVAASPFAVLDHFRMSLMTEGAGTQIFATTFVQWASRECIRRAQPETLIVRYTPRQLAQTMNLMLAGATPQGLDPRGSLIDADLGAYYAWLGMRRLSGSDQLRFLAWFEAHSEAVAIGPGLPQGTSSDSKLRLDQVLDLLA